MNLPTSLSSVGKAALASIALLGLGFPPLSAQVAVDDAAVTALESDEVVEMAPFTGYSVIGSEEEIFSLPGSGYYLDAADLQDLQYTDINRILRQVPGVYVREEDGYGLFPNISLRGVDSGRSSKVTLMEDGILAAPAPYSAPAAYYSPTAGRMAGLEVLKGSSQVKYGPHTTGGVINYLSTPIPETSDLSGRAMGAFGADDEIKGHLYAGQTLEDGVVGGGKLGYVAEWFHQQTDGFKTIDDIGARTNADETGFEKNDYMVKIGYEFDTAKRNYLEFKIGYTDLDSDESYLGLNSADFGDDPYRRYAATRLDSVATNQTRTYLRHLVDLSPDTRFTTTLYYNKFHRNWYKLNDLRNVDTDGDGVGDGVNFNLAEALMNTEALQALKGQRVADFRVRANNRDYYSGGIQFDLDHRFETGALEHFVETGVRLHRDRIRRFQWQDIFAQDAAGDWTQTADGIPGTQANRLQESNAIAYFLQDEISVGRWAFTPGIRYEYVDMEWVDYSTNIPVDGNTFGDATSGSLDVFAPGIGVTYEAAPDWTVFGGYHRGFSVPSPRAHLRGGLEEETSDSFELGTRHRRGAWYGELVFFYTDFQDLIVNNNIGAGGTGDTENIGGVETKGIELLAGYDLGEAMGWSFRNPYTVAVTYTDAQFTEDVTADPAEDQESIFAGASKGNEVPYVPEWQFNITAGIEYEKVRTYLSGTFVDEAFASGNNSDLQVRPDTGTPNANFGTVDSRFIVDWSLYYQVAKNVELFTTVTNLLDEEYIASRQPYGPRAGAPRLWSLGVQVDF